MTADKCYVTSIDGGPVRVQGKLPVTAEDRAALEEVVRAAKRMMAELPPPVISYECPACGAKPGAFCRNDKDRVTAAHSSRRALAGSDEGSPE